MTFACVVSEAATLTGVIWSQELSRGTTMKASYAALGVSMLFVGMLVGLLIALHPVG